MELAGSSRQRLFDICYYKAYTNLIKLVEIKFFDQFFLQKIFNFINILHQTT